MESFDWWAGLDLAPLEGVPGVVIRERWGIVSRARGGGLVGDWHCRGGACRGQSGRRLGVPLRIGTD